MCVSHNFLMFFLYLRPLHGGVRNPMAAGAKIAKNQERFSPVLQKL